MTDKPALIALVRQKAEKYGLDGDLVCALVEQESDWSEWAVRYEPGFMRRYVGPLYTQGNMSATEAYTRSMSWGLLQIMGEVAREYGFTGPFLSELCDPEVGLDWGCKYFSALMGRHGNDVKASLLAWNGGGNVNYPAEVLARVDTYNA